MAGLVGCGGEETSQDPPDPPVETGWRPGQALPGERQGPRGQLDLRGLIHAHSVNSHDACDGEPWDEATGATNEPCFDDFRRDVCRVGHDFVMLSDHGERFSRTEFPDTLLYRADRGDRLVERAGGPVASFAACRADDQLAGGPADVLILAGNESAMMPVGLPGHIAATEAERDAVYGAASADNVSALQAHGAVVLAQHTEDWTTADIVDLGFDGFEMYNLHANTIQGAGGVLELIGLQNQAPEELPAPDLFLLNILNEDARYLERWGDVLATGRQAVTTIGTDCHQNTFPQLLEDGERIDSYRRMMAWMSNHLLVRADPDGSYDDRHLVEALREGRLYGVFEVLGFPTGFDFHAEAGGATHEMGARLSLSSDLHLRVTAPEVRDLDPGAEAPKIVSVLYRAVAGGFEEVTRVEGDLDEAVAEPGAYRVEIRMEPRHLREHLGALADLADREIVWIYGNAIVVDP